MILIPAGPAVLGTSAQQAAQLAAKYRVDPSLFLDTERPLETVSVRVFYIDRYEVTNREYRHFRETSGHPAPSIWANGTYPEGHDEDAVSGVSLEDAQAHAWWVGKRLPT
jgi:formylglycine-generating enzyme required for sulfatase activity